MKRLRLSFLGLFMSAVAVQGQVVFSEDEKNYVASYASSTSMKTTASTPGAQDIPENGFRPSDILSNWYVSGNWLQQHLPEPLKDAAISLIEPHPHSRLPLGNGTPLILARVFL